MQQLTPQQQQLLMQQLYLQQQQALLTGQQLNPQQLQALQVMMLMQRNQALLQQQQLMAGRQGGAAAASPYLAGMQATSLSRVAGEAPPAKRQAMDAAALNHQAQILAAQQFRQLHANGTISNMSQSQQQTVFQTLYTRARAQLTAAATSAVPSRGGMRVTIDKRNRAALDKLFNAEDTTDKDHADEVVRRCEEISKALRSHLGKGVKGLQGDGRFGGTDVTAADEYQQVTQKQLIEACGDTARYLKPYQIVGVNFLMLLYRTRIGGGEPMQHLPLLLNFLV